MKLLEAVLNTLWQGAALAVFAWAGMRWLPRINAATRCAVWWIVLALTLALPLTQIDRRPPQFSGSAVASGHMAPAIAASEADVPAVPAFSERRARLELHDGDWIALLAFWWFAIFIGQLARLFASLFYIRGIKRRAEPATGTLGVRFGELLRYGAVRRRVRLLLSTRIASPVAVGFLRPAVVLPATLTEQLSPAELDHVLLHEIAHIARRDDWFHLIATFAWAALALHPVAGWVLRRIEREREAACDDWVVAATGAPQPYARSLARLFELCSPRGGLLLASGIAGRGSHLGDRIAMLLRRGRAFTARASAPRVAAFTVMLIAAAGLTSQAPWWVAFAQPPSRGVQPAQPARPRPHSFLASLVAAGYGDLAVEDIVNLKDQGVTGEFLLGLGQTGWGKLAVADIINLKNQGVSPEYVRDIHALGFGPYTPGEMIQLKQQGVSTDLFRALKAYGITQARAAEVIDAHNQGLRENHLREAREHWPKLTLGQIIKLRQSGVI